jgi:hypothetical protein
MALLFLWPALPALSQEAAPAPDPETLLADIRLLRDVETLQLSLDQVKAILPHVQEIQTHVERIAELRTETFQKQARTIYHMRTALAAARPPGLRDNLALGRALQDLQSRVAGEQQDIVGLAQRVLGELNDTQRGLIETPAEEQARLQRLEALGGHTQAADFIVSQFRQIRDLLPDEYARSRGLIAENIVGRVEPPGSPRIPALTVAVLALMDEVYSLDPAQFAQRAPDLAHDIQTRLELSPIADVPPTAGKLTQTEFQEFLTDPRTVPVLQGLLAWRPGRAVPLE